MKNNTIEGFLRIAVIVCTWGICLSSCQVGSAPEGTCKNDLSVSKVQTLHANDTGNARFFYHETTYAKSSCEAHYYFSFSWASPDSINARSRPPLDDMTHNFSPGGLQGLVSYFPHPEEEKGVLPAAPWTIDFSIGNKNSSSDTTIYTVYANLKSGTPLKDSVWVYSRITFTGVK